MLMSDCAPFRSLTTALGLPNVSFAHLATVGHTYLGSCRNKDFRPGLQVTNPSFEMLYSRDEFDLDFEEILQVLGR